MATRVLKGIKFFQQKSEEDHGSNISVKFHNKRPVMALYRSTG